MASKFFFQSVWLHRSISALILCGVVSGCTPAADQRVNDAAANMSTCDVVHALVQGHATGFEKLRSNRAQTPYGDIWKARYDVVGSGCEIWQSGKGNTHYVCTRSAPDKATADGYYNAARDTVRGCLGSDWKETEEPRKLGVGVKSTFSKSGEKAAVLIHEVQSDGVLKQQWTIYYMVGEPNENL